MHNRETEEAPSVSPPNMPVGEGEGADQKTARLESDLARAQDQTRRAVADLDNYRKRFDRDLARLREQDREALLRDLLSVVDSLERALDGADLDKPIPRSGIEAVYRQLVGILKRYGVEPIEAKGRHFDPVWHEAVGTAHTGVAEGTITDVVQRGYRMGDRPLRPARVIVEKLGLEP